MYEQVIIISSWLSAAMLVALSWLIHRYSKNFAGPVNYWKYISLGILLFAASEIGRPLYEFNESLLAIYWGFLIFGGVFLAYGFYNLYQEAQI